MNKRIGNFEFRITRPLSRKWEITTEYYEIVKWSNNPFYGKENEYDWDEIRQCYHPKNTMDYFIHYSPTVFKNKESCFTVATYVYDKHEPCWDLKSIGDRISTSCETKEDVLNLHQVIEYGFDQLKDLVLNDDENEQL